MLRGAGLTPHKSELSAHQMGPAGAIPHPSPHFLQSDSGASPVLFILLRLATPALGLGVLAGSWQRSEAYVLLVVCYYSLMPFDVTGTCFPGVRLLALPEVRKGPWPLRRPRGDGNGGRFVRSPCLFRGTVCACCTQYTRHFPLWSLYSDGPLSSRPQPLGRGGDVAPCDDTREDFGLSLQLPATTYCCSVVFKCPNPVDRVSLSWWTGRAVIQAYGCGHPRH